MTERDQPAADAVQEPGPTAGTLPIVDLERLPRHAGARERIARRLDRALREVGFCYLSNTGVDPTLRRDIFEASRAFHRLDPDAKAALSINAYHRGYIAPGSSQLRSSRIAEVRTPNLSESFMLMQEVAEDDPELGQPLHGPNQWPDLPGFRSAAEAYTSALSGLALELTRLMCQALGLDARHLDPHFAKPLTWLRLLHYPPMPPGTAEDQFGAAPHTDYGHVTILAQEELGGLEVRAPQGRWIAAPPLADTFVLNVGDMLEHWTGGRWPSTPHRVRNASGRSRYSVPFFYDPHLDTVVEPLPGLGQGETRAILYRDYLLERLSRNYAYRAAAG